MFTEYLGPASYDSDGREPERDRRIEIKNVTTDSYSDGSDSDNIPTIEAGGRFYHYFMGSYLMIILGIIICLSPWKHKL